jgi:citrate synthase
MDTLRTTVSLLGGGDSATAGITPSIRADALRLFAVLPSIIAAEQRHHQGLGAIAPRDHLGYAANFLYMTFGKVPEPQIVDAFETSLILYAEHGTSACTDRVRTAASSDLYSAVAAAIGTLKRSPHACAGEAVMRMLDEIAIPDNAEPWLEEALTAGQEIVGFGRHVCENGDSRLATMRAALGVIAALRGGQHLVETYDALATAVREATGLSPTLDYPIGPAYHLVGWAASAFAPLLVAASIPNWTARMSAH